MLIYLLEKEFKQFFRNSFLPKMVVILPLVAMLIFPLIANFEIKNINLSVVDHDKSTQSRQLIQKIQSSGYFRITNVAESYREAIRSVEKNESDMLIEIPTDFEKELESGSGTKVLVATNAVNGMKGGLGSSYIMTILNNYSSQIALRRLTPEISMQSSTMQTPDVEIIPRYWFNPELRYLFLMIPALMIMVLAIVSGFLPAMNIVGEKESGTIEQMNVTPVNRFLFIISKLIPYWMVGFVVLTISILVSLLVYGFLARGSYITLYLFASMFMLAFSGFGLVISNYAKTMQQAIFMILFFLLTFIFLSGFYTPITNMPKWGQVLSNFSPFKYIIQAVRMIYLKGTPFKDLIPNFLALCGFAVFFNGWAVLSYRKRS
ncbi:MAG: ABC transporter permease [Bacteroidales bacterium]|nr:ABC transporter permease [Bacteroidales bacterium]MDD2426038.1 ABC transporter permease [Bacteroidales bacterium]MDD3990256.1 ABC transporter permease [Bacteroidales bacterium]